MWAALATSCGSCECGSFASCVLPPAPTHLIVGSGATLVAMDLEDPAVPEVTRLVLEGPIDLLRRGEAGSGSAPSALWVSVPSRQELISVVDTKGVLQTPEMSSNGDPRLRLVELHAGTDRWLSVYEGVAPADSGSFSFGPSRGEAVPPIPLGPGHHTVTLVDAPHYALVTSADGCNTVISVLDVSFPDVVVTRLSLAASQLGWDGSSPSATCDPNVPRPTDPHPSGCVVVPHGSGMPPTAACRLDGNGSLVFLDPHAGTFQLLSTHGAGPGAMAAAPDVEDRLYLVQSLPREGQGGQPCQVGQLAVVDDANWRLVAELPLLYDGPDCTRTLVSDEAGIFPGGMVVDGRRIFVLPSTDAASISRQVLVVEAGSPAGPVQSKSLAVGAGAGARVFDGGTYDNREIYLLDNVDATVTVIDPFPGSVTQTLRVLANPSVLGVLRVGSPAR
jgi:hypothetical protein